MPVLLTLGELRLEGVATSTLSSPRIELTLLAYLARRAPRPVGRGELAELFWRDRDTAKARQSLRQTLLELRRRLGGGHCLGPAVGGAAAAGGGRPPASDRVDTPGRSPFGGARPTCGVLLSIPGSGFGADAGVSRAGPRDRAQLGGRPRTPNPRICCPLHPRPHRPGCAKRLCPPACVSLPTTSSAGLPMNATRRAADGSRHGRPDPAREVASLQAHPAGKEAGSHGARAQQPAAWGRR